MTVDVLKAAEQLAQDGISAEVIDLATISPIDCRDDPRVGGEDRPTGDRARGRAQLRRRRRDRRDRRRARRCTTCSRRSSASPASTPSCRCTGSRTTTFPSIARIVDAVKATMEAEFRMTTFNLPDLGEGLPEAEIVAWHVQGRRSRRGRSADAVGRDGEGRRRSAEPLHRHDHASCMRRPATPCRPASRWSISIVPAGATAAPATSPRRHSPVASRRLPDKAWSSATWPSSDEEFVDRAIAGGARRTSTRDRVRAAPAVRMLAKRLGVELAACSATGRHGLVSVDDVLAAANLGARASAIAVAVPFPA